MTERAASAASIDRTARALATLGRRFAERGWVLGTSGNFSAVVRREPLRLAITASALDKGRLSARHVLSVNGRGERLGGGRLRPSAETLLHLEIIRRRGATAVLHTHSVWSTMLSDAHAANGGFAIEGYEMLKGLAGVTTHLHREWVPIVENDQDMRQLAAVLGSTLDTCPSAHGILLRRHGLYTWGSTIASATRHVEVLEFLFETIGRTATFTHAGGYHGGPQGS
jgi:methylthioribulose-1-phosphate dehydratase